MLRQADVGEIRRTLETKLTILDAQRLNLKYVPEGRLPAAAIVSVEGVELRLEKDYFDGCWTVATNEGAPRLLHRFSENQLGKPMLGVLEQTVAHLRECF